MQFRLEPLRLAVVTVLLLSVASCATGVDQEPRSATGPRQEATVSHPAASKPHARGSASPDASPSQSTSPSATPSAAAASTPPAARSSSRTPLRQRLLSAEELPGFNDEFSWRAAGTRGREGKDTFGTCHRYAMTSIGAMRVTVAEYAPAKGSAADTASELVAEFPDPRTAIRAFEVLKSWRAGCEEKLSAYEQHRVGGLQKVEVPSGRAAWYMLQYGPPENGSEDEGWFDSQGIARVGRRIAVLQMRLLGQDFNYPAGQEPMVEAVRRAAAKLG